MGTPRGGATLQLAPPNDLGVLDHHVETPDGRTIHVPMRTIPNGGDCEVLFTVFRQPGMTDDAYASDIAQVETDLARLKSLLDSPSGQ